MGTSGSYKGAGGAAGKATKAGIDRWLNQLPFGEGSGGTPPDGPTVPSAPASPRPPGHNPVPLPAQLIAGVLSLIRPSGGSGGGVGGGARSMGGGGSHSTSRGGVRRSASRAAGAAGRAAAGAYAYATANLAELVALGLNYGELLALGDTLEVTRRIVDAACGPRSDSTIGADEERYAAAIVAGWVLEQSGSDQVPGPEAITRYAIATIITEVISTEMGAALKEHPQGLAAVADAELRAAADVLASQAELSVQGATAAELSAAIESGIEALRRIYGGPS